MTAVRTSSTCDESTRAHWIASRPFGRVTSREGPVGKLSTRGARRKSTPQLAESHTQKGIGRTSALSRSFSAAAMADAIIGVLVKVGRTLRSADIVRTLRRCGRTSPCTGAWRRRSISVCGCGFSPSGRPTCRRSGPRRATRRGRPSGRNPSRPGEAPGPAAQQAPAWARRCGAGCVRSLRTPG